MKCINHPEVDVTGTCIKCGKGLCNDCIRWLHGKTYCHPCAYNIPTQKAGAAFTLTESKDGRIDVNQDKASKLLEASKILLYLALIIGIVIPSCSVIIVWYLGAPDIPKIIVIFLCTFLFTGIALFILAAICRIIASNQRDTQRSSRTTLAIPSEDIPVPNAGLDTPINQPFATLGTKMTPAVPPEDIKRPAAGLDNMKCVNHPDADATTVCAKCGKNLCISCKQELHNKPFCLGCAKELLISNKADIPLIHTKKKRGGINFYEATSHYRYLKHLNNVAGVCLIAGLLLTFILPLCFIFPLLATPGGQNTLDTMVKAGIVLDVIGVILTLLSLYLHLAMRIGIRIATLLLGIILIIFGIVYIVKF